MNYSALSLQMFNSHSSNNNNNNSHTATARFKAAMMVAVRTLCTAINGNQFICSAEMTL